MGNKKIDLEKYSKEYEERWFKSHTKHEHYVRFEHEIRLLMVDLTPKPEKLDIFDYSQLLESLLAFILIDDFHETNEIFINNLKNTFYKNLNTIKTKFNKDINYIKLFVETYIF